MLQNRSMGFDLTVDRVNAFSFKARRFRVEVDGADVGLLRAGRNLHIELPEGRHEVRVHVGAAKSRTVTVEAGSVGSLSLVAKPADIDAAARTERLASSDPFLLTLTEGDDESWTGPTFGQFYAVRPRSLSNPARNRTQQALWVLS